MVHTFCCGSLPHRMWLVNHSLIWSYFISPFAALITKSYFSFWFPRMSRYIAGGLISSKRMRFVCFHLQMDGLKLYFKNCCGFVHRERIQLSLIKCLVWSIY